jgi:pre-mRNA-splicing factor 38A
MANVTDPLALPIHGTNPQNLIEYITRQRIYDSQYWKEQCFGLTAADVLEKAVNHIQAIGGSYGGNNKPTRFLCLILKMLQIQPDEGIIDELINNEEFKYVRALGVFYLRLTGRPAEIYEKLEPLYNDYRKLRYRNPTDWKLLYMDEFIDELLVNERVCGIALPRLPKREMLEEAGYLDGPRRSAVQNLIGETRLDEDMSDNEKLEEYINGTRKIESLLKQMSDDGNAAATQALSTRTKNGTILNSKNNTSNDFDSKSGIKRKYMDDNDLQRSDSIELEQHDKSSSRGKDNKEKKKSKNKFGSLFKTLSNPPREENESVIAGTDGVHENSEEYWNEQRAKLGLKPLKK